jgi:hypothetical protein
VVPAGFLVAGVLLVSFSSAPFWHANGTAN